MKKLILHVYSVITYLLTEMHVSRKSKCAVFILRLWILLEEVLKI